MKKSAVRICGFMGILCLMLWSANQILKFKYPEGIYCMTKYYQLEDDTVDVLILGSSRAFEDINTGTLWDEYGMASYALGSAVQPMWSTYYYLEEALKTQDPEIIVLEGSRAQESGEYVGDEKVIKSLYGLRWSANKVKAMGPAFAPDRFTEFFPTNVRYHARYTELSKADFCYDQGNPLYKDWKGFMCNMETTPAGSWDPSSHEDRIQLPEKSEEYYRKIIERVQELNIPIVVVISPFSGINEVDAGYQNSIEDIAAEYGVEYINANFLVSAIGLDYTTDAADSSHLNYRGSRKYTKYLGEVLKEHYDISDRRGDPRYESWQRDADFIAQMIYDQELRELTESDEIIEKIKDEDYILFVSVDGSCTTSEEMLQGLYQELGIEGAGNGGDLVS